MSQVNEADFQRFKKILVEMLARVDDRERLRVRVDCLKVEVADLEAELHGAQATADRLRKEKDLADRHLAELQDRVQQLGVTRELVCDCDAGWVWTTCGEDTCDLSYPCAVCNPEGRPWNPEPRADEGCD